MMHEADIKRLREQDRKPGLFSTWKQVWMFGCWTLGMWVALLAFVRLIWWAFQ